MGVEPLLEGIEFGGMIADKAFDNDAIIADLNDRGAKIVISQHPRRAKPLPLDREISKWRHLIENFFCKLKDFRRIAMRADKTGHSFKAMICVPWTDRSRFRGPSAWQRPCRPFPDHYVGTEMGSACAARQ